MSMRLPASARREQILDVSVQVFARNGFHSTSMNDVAEAAGVTKPVLYQHFDSKQDLYLALLDEAGNRLRNAVSKAVASADHGKEQTEIGFQGLLPLGRRRPRCVPAAVRLTRQPRRREHHRHPPHHCRDRARHRPADRRRHRARAPAHARAGLVGLAEGVSRHLVERGEQFDPEVLGQQVADLAWAGLRAVHRIG